MTTTDPWNPNQYHRFRNERRQPFYDLLALVHREENMGIVDLGCGTGELTLELHRRLQPTTTLGIDRSENMLAQATRYSDSVLAFQYGDIATFDHGPFDLIFSNAALHWVPNHEELIPRLAALLTDQGQLAFQVPANHNHPSHVSLAQVAAEEPFASALEGFIRHSPVLQPEAYAHLIHKLGFSEQSVRLQVYPHLLANREEVVEWMKGTAITEYERRLPEELRPTFLQRFTECIREALPDQQPFFLPYNRILVWARR